MRAIRIHEHGGSDVLHYEDAPDPHLTSPSDVIVKLSTASLNDIDIRTRRGRIGNRLSFPHILGADGAGRVVESGADAKHVSLGDRVSIYPVSGCGNCEWCASGREYICAEMAVVGARQDGTYAEYIRVPARNCFRLPAGVRFEEAAALPLAYLSMWRMLVTHAGIRPGEYILIVGEGGMSAASVQLALHIGGRVFISSSSQEAAAKAASWGAERVTDYTHPDFVQDVRAATGKRGLDIVIDCVGGETWLKSIAVLAKGGRLVAGGAAEGCHTKTDVRRIFWNHLKIFGSQLGDREEFQQVVNFFDATRVKPIVDRIFPLSKAAVAHQYFEESKPFGKVVLRIDSGR